MNHFDNPAGRLVLLLEQSLEIDDQVKMKEALTKLFNIELDHQSEILRKLGELQQIPSRIREKVHSLDVNQELLLEGLKNVEIALSSIRFGSQWKIFKKFIDEKTVYSIKVCSDALSKHTPEKVLTVDELDKLKERVRIFKDQLHEYDIDPELNRFIFEKVGDIERAIFDYNLTGAVLIQKEVESIVGSSFFRNELLRKNESVTKNLFEFIGYVSSIVHLSEYGPLLKEQVNLLIGP
ncbi:MAG: hypothetical protein WEA58_10160 [Balneolaceae bacterium]